MASDGLVFETNERHHGRTFTPLLRTFLPNGLPIGSERSCRASRSLRGPPGFMPIGPSKAWSHPSPSLAPHCRAVCASCGTVSGPGPCTSCPCAPCARYRGSAERRSAVREIRRAAGSIPAGPTRRASSPPRPTHTSVAENAHGLREHVGSRFLYLVFAAVRCVPSQAGPAESRFPGRLAAQDGLHLAGVQLPLSSATVRPRPQGGQVF